MSSKKQNILENKHISFNVQIKNTSATQTREDKLPPLHFGKQMPSLIFISGNYLSLTNVPGIMTDVKRRNVLLHQASRK